MIKAVFYKDSEDGICGFKISGHAGFAKSGKDIVCSAVSVLTINTINSIESFTDNKYKLDNSKSGLILFKFLSQSDEKGQLLLKSLLLGLEGIESEYGSRYLQINFKEV